MAAVSLFWDTNNTVVTSCEDGRCITLVLYSGLVNAVAHFCLRYYSISFLGLTLKSLDIFGQI